MSSLPFVPSLAPFCFSLLFIAFSSNLLQLCAAQRSQNCRNPVTTCDPTTDYFSPDKKFTIEYANETIRDVTFFNTYVDFRGRALKLNTFILYRFVICGCPVPPNSKDRQVLYINPTSVFVGETPTLALLAVLDPKFSTLKYTGNVTFIYSPKVRQLVKNNTIRQASTSDFSTNFDLLRRDINLSASLIGSFSTDGYLEQKQLAPFISIGEVLENNPLARAEWMKIVGLFLNQSEKAEDNFRQIVTRYESAKRDAAKAIRRPSVLVNYPSTISFPPEVDLAKSVNDNYNWIFPASHEYVTQLLDDANADYRYRSNLSSGPMKATMSQVFAGFSSARFHLLTGQFPVDETRTTLERYMKDLVLADNSDARVTNQFQRLAAVKCDNVWNREKRVSEDGRANDYFESAIFQPDEVLRDLVSILHPHVRFGNRKMRYMSQYKAETSEYTRNCPYNDFSVPAPPNKTYINMEYRVATLDRFEIEDMWESSTEKMLKTINVKADYDILFEPKHSKREDTVLLIRARLDKEDAETGTKMLNRSEGVLSTLQESLGVGVVQINPDGTERGIIEGIQGGTIAFIAVGCIAIFIAIGAFFCIAGKMQSHHRRHSALVAGQEVYPNMGDVGM